MTKSRMALAAFLTALSFTILDALVHYFYEPLEIYYYPYKYFGVQSPLLNYAMSKLVASTVILFILFYLFAKTDWNPYVRYGLITLILVGLLEIRYIISGRYDAQWHVLNFINHFLTLSISLYLVDRLGFMRRTES